jgi:SAM-dependent methyltransferase
VGAYALRLTEPEIARYRWMAHRARVSETELWQTAGITPGARIADVGCGPGAVLALLAEAAGPTGRVVGVDGDADAVAVARSLLASAGARNAEVRVGRADDTGLDPDDCDVVMLRHVLAHNGGAEQAIVDHLATLVRPGGIVYLLDVDLTAMRLFPDTAAMSELLDRYIRFHSGRGNDPQVGLRLGHLLRAAGLVVVEHRGWFEIGPLPPWSYGPPWAAREAMVSAGCATQDDIRRWSAELRRLDAADERPLFFAAQFAALGRRATPDG